MELHKHGKYDRCVSSCDIFGVQRLEMMTRRDIEDKLTLRMRSLYYKLPCVLGQATLHQARRFIVTHAPPFVRFMVEMIKDASILAILGDMIGDEI